MTIAARAPPGGAPQRHRLAGRASVSIADLLDEPFLALPASAGPLRDHFLAVPERDGHPVRVAAEINDTEETYEAVASGIGICLLAAGNAPIFDRGDVTMLPVATSAPPSSCSPGTSAAARLCSRRSPGCARRSRASPRRHPRRDAVQP